MTSLLEAQRLAHTFRKPQVVQNDQSQGRILEPEMEIQKVESSLLWVLGDKLRSYPESQGEPLKERNDQARILREKALTEIGWID